MSDPSTTPASLGEGTIVSVRRSVLPARIDILGEARVRFVGFLDDIGVAPEVRDQLALGFTEALTNAIKHGCRGDAAESITLQWSSDARRVLLAIEHRGEGPPADSFETARLPDDPLATSGRGFFLMRQIFDDCRIWREADRVRMEFTKACDALRPAGEAADDLSQILEELANSYESLAAFQRMGNVLITASRAAEFLDEGLESLRQINGDRQPDRLWLCLSEGVLESVQEELSEVEGVRPWSQTPELIRETLASGDSRVWRGRAEIAGDETFADFAHGCVFPITANGEALACLVIAMRDEASGFGSTELTNLRTFTDLFGIALANANLQTLRRSEARAVRELELAAEIQRMLLPVAPPPVSERWQLFLEHRSAHEVAGDFLEARHDVDGNLVLTVIDVMGKGVSAAMLASVYRTAFLMNLEKSQTLDAFAGSLNGVLASQLGELSMFVTCALVRIDAEGEWIEIVNAGHCPVLLFAEGRVVEQVEASGPPLGIFEDSAYEVERRRVENTPGLLLVTDGLFEWQHEGHWWGWERFVELADRTAFADPGTLWRDVQQRIDQLDGELHDDQTLMFWKRADLPCEVAGSSASLTTAAKP